MIFAGLNLLLCPFRNFALEKPGDESIYDIGAMSLYRRYLDLDDEKIELISETFFLTDDM